MDGNGECLAALTEDVMRSADVFQRPAMLPKEPDEIPARHQRTIQPRSCTGQGADAQACVGPQARRSHRFVLESIVNANAIKKVLRSRSVRRVKAREHLYVIESPTFTGTWV